MNVVGIVPAKQHSSRFPGKNSSSFRGSPLFWHSVVPLIEARSVQHVVVASDSPHILDYCTDRGVSVQLRSPAASHTDEPLLDVLKYVVKTLEVLPDAVVCIMANCPGHTGAEVDAAVNLLFSGGLREVRGFGASGIESGLLAMRASVLTGQLQISSHMGAVAGSGVEIHFREELEQFIREE